MKDPCYNVGISCIGSGVGQSVINSCRLARMPIRTIGLGTNPLAYGLYECDDYAYTASYYADDYIEDMLKTCLELQIDLLIPGHDEEAHLLSKNLELFESKGTRVLVSDAKLLGLCREKDQMSMELNSVAHIFVRSFGHEGFLTTWKSGGIELPVIAKPRDGFASRGIEIIRTERDFDKITDGHIVQELALPHDGDPNREHCLNMISKGVNPQVSEVSIQFVFDRSGGVIGKMASYNKLSNGVPIEILPIDDEVMWAQMEQLLPKLVQLGARGPVNLQGRITNNGIKLFEINARFTGITGLRAALGFNEVEACIRLWMGMDYAPLVINHSRFGIRQTADKAVDLEFNPEVKNMVLDLNSDVLKKTKTILITGASGAIGSRLVSALSGDARYKLFTLDRNKARTDGLAKDCGCLNYDYRDLAEGRFSLGNVDCLIHLASARPHSGSEELATSLSSTFSLLTRAVSQGVSEIINVSSQSVYGTNIPPPWNEGSPVHPVGAYASYKHAIEVYLESIKQLYPLLRSSSIRLAAVAAPDLKSLEVEALGKMTVQAKRGGTLKIFGGSQKMERIDVRDAVSGLVRIMETPSKQWRPIYNLGPGIQYSLREIAEVIAEEVNSKNTNYKVGIEVVQADKVFASFGMDVSSVKNSIGWSAEYTLRESVQHILELLRMNENISKK